MGDDDDDEAVRAHLEKRREELANEDTQMEEVPAAADASGEMMDVDDAAGAQEEDIDPLDAFMANLSETKPNRPAFQGQAMFSDDNEPVETSVEVEDLMALTAAKKKKKNEIPKIDHDKVEYQPFRKNFYTEPAEVTAMTPEEVADLRLELDGIKVQPEPLPRPVVKWAQMGLLQPTMDVFAKLRFEKPTPIQAQAIPIIESGRNLIGIAKTGSGKTLAFGIPMVRHIIDQPPLKSSDGPIALILAPTRELAVQIVAELKTFLKPSGLHIASAYGGSPISDQIAMIKRGGIHVLCATPGRLIELLGSNGGRVLSTRRITYVVLDEADRMFDMGFEPQVIKILETVRPDRQAILFSATFPKNMAALARRALVDPAEVVIGGRSVVAPEVEQVVKLVKPADKLNELISTLGLLFMNNENAQVLIFVERQETAEDLLHKLMKAKYRLVNTIHGAKDQTDRSEAINDFKQGSLPILIATSVAARGLDVPNLAMVFNFDCPTHLEDYVHRCGRTGRAGNKGTAVTLIEKPGEESLAYHVLKALTQSGKEILPELQEMANEYKQKIKRGEVKVFSGYGGTGLERLDESRADSKRQQKRALRIEGEEVSDDEEELPAVKKSDADGKDAKVEDDIPSYMKILNSSISVSKTERPAAGGPSKPMTAKERAMAAANKVDGRLSKKGMIHHGQPIDNKGPDAGAFHATVVINDFPQEARWAVTNRTNVVKILESTGVSITSKGIYYPEGKVPAEDGEPKLYLLVEGDTENAVSTAMRELYQHLVAGVKQHNEKASTRGATGRYKID
jgi:ATP-dependent RNA helicase DDX46/PRP5